MFVDMLIWSVLYFNLILHSVVINLCYEFLFAVKLSYS